MTNKKVITLVVALMCMLIACATALVVVLVDSANQKATSQVNVRFTASDVSVSISAKAYYGPLKLADQESNTFTSTGQVGGAESIELTPDSRTGSLSQTNNGTAIEIDSTNRVIAFEYIFTNLSDVVATINLTDMPTSSNFVFTYVYRDTKASNALIKTYQDLEKYPKKDNVRLEANATKYIYVIAKVENALNDASLEGDFGWELNRYQPAEFKIGLTTYQFDEGMTWTQFIASDYNTAGIVNEGGLICLPSDNSSEQIIIVTDSSYMDSAVSGSQTIIKDCTYYTYYNFV